MKRLLLISSLLLTLTLATLAVSVNVISSSAAEPAPPDPSLPVRLANGTDMPLGEVLDRLQRGEPLPWHAPENLVPEPTSAEILAAASAAARGAPASGSAPDVRRERSRRWPRTPASIELAFSAFGPAFVLAEQQLHVGNLDQALALYGSIREGEPGWAYAQRRIGWHILAKGKDQPALAVAYVNKAVLADPFSHNSWQDLTRVYSRALGFRMH